ncbi:hypothetical protein EI555_020466, partial [Monodon monoceros]
CLLPTANGKSCLHCWPELPALIDYDLQILWGTPGPPAELSHSLHSLFLDSHAFLESCYLGQDHLEEAAGTLFTHIDKAIEKFRDDKPSLLEEVHVLKQQFSKHLEDLSEELKEKTSAPHWKSSAVPTARHTSSPAKTPLSAQVSGQPAILACSRPTSTSKSIVVSGLTRRNLVWAVSLGIALPLAALAGGGCYIFWLKKKKKEKEAEKEVLGHPELPRRGSCVGLGAARLATPSLAPGASHPKEYRIKGRDSGGPPSAPSTPKGTEPVLIARGVSSSLQLSSRDAINLGRLNLTAL